MTSTGVSFSSSFMAVPAGKRCVAGMGRCSGGRYDPPAYHTARGGGGDSPPPGIRSLFDLEHEDVTLGDDLRRVHQLEPVVLQLLDDQSPVDARAGIGHLPGLDEVV